MIFRLLTFLSFFGLMACKTNRNFEYLKNLRGTLNEKTPIVNKVPLRIQPDDLLGISVSSLNPESAILFNKGILATSSTSSTESAVVSNALNSALSNKPEREGYLVDRQGYIDFPVLGRVKVSDLTKEEAAQYLTTEISKYLKRPVVSIRLLNFTVTVIGEVAHPAALTVTRESINVLEALGMAGDMTEYGKRETVLIIRQQNGVRTSTRIDLTNKDVLDTPYFYLQQNDIVYVEPNSRVKNSQNNPNNKFISLWATLLSIASSVIISSLLRN